MKEIIVVIEASKDGFGAYAENVSGLYGAGSTIEECKNSFLEAIGINEVLPVLNFALYDFF